MFLALALLIGLNGNLWIAGDVLFPVLIAAAVATTVVAIQKKARVDLRTAMPDGFALLATQVTTLLVLFAAFKMHRYWLLEAVNHDSLLYYQGMLWSKESPLFVSKVAAQARWALGTCDDGISWIGYDCSLYRGGSYTIAAWAQYLAPRTTGNALYFVGGYAATMAWLAARLSTTKLFTRGQRSLTVILTAAVVFSTGLIGSLVNSNLATVLGSASLLPIIATALRSDLTPTARFGSMAAWCAVATHFYAELFFYAALFIGLVFILEASKHLRFYGTASTVRLAAITTLIALVAGNIAVGQAVSSILFFSGMAKGAEWFSWYLHQPPVLWTGSFLAGLLMGGPMPSVWVVSMAALITACVIVILLFIRQTCTAISALTITSMLAVLYVEQSGYQYAEHKIVHLLGPSWTFVVAFTGLHLASTAGKTDLPALASVVRKIAGALILCSLALVSTGFIANARNLLDASIGPHGLDFGLDGLASHIQPGNTVLMDDMAWIGVEKFHKGHYLIFKTHDRGARALMPKTASDPLRGGYFHDIRQNSLLNAEKVDWLVQGRGSRVFNSVFFGPWQQSVWENENYVLYDVKKKPVAVAGDGWYDCEPSQCWTRNEFEIETHTPSNGEFSLSIDFNVFEPPVTGTISVRGAAGQIIATSSADSRHMRLKLARGYSRLIFSGDWPLKSPADLGLSSDQRKLFAKISQVTVSETK